MDPEPPTKHRILSIPIPAGKKSLDPHPCSYFIAMTSRYVTSDTTDHELELGVPIEITLPSVPLPPYGLRGVKRPHSKTIVKAGVYILSTVISSFFISLLLSFPLSLHIVISLTHTHLTRPTATQLVRAQLLCVQEVETLFITL